MSVYSATAPFFFPNLFFAGQVADGTPANVVLEDRPAFVLLIEGIDIWPLIAAQTAQVTVVAPIPYFPETQVEIWGINQTPSEVGPWSWRGFLSCPFAGGTLSVNATGSFGVTVWGRSIPALVQI